MKRRFPRIQADLPMMVRVIADREAPALQGRCTVVSECGLGATLPGDIPLGDIVSLDLCFPDTGGTVRVWATVKYSAQPKFGLEFFSLGEAQRQVINRYCQLNGRPPRPVLLDAIRKYFFAGKH